MERDSRAKDWVLFHWGPEGLLEAGAPRFSSIICLGSTVAWDPVACFGPLLQKQKLDKNTNVFIRFSEYYAWVFWLKHKHNIHIHTQDGDKFLNSYLDKPWPTKHSHFQDFVCFVYLCNIKNNTNISTFNTKQCMCNVCRNLHLANVWMDFEGCQCCLKGILNSWKINTTLFCVTYCVKPWSHDRVGFWHN